MTNPDLIDSASRAMALGQYPAAVRYIQQYLLEEPDHLEARLALIRALIGAGELEAANKVVMALAGKNSGPEIAFLMAEVQIARRDWPRAADAMRQVPSPEASPESADLWARYYLTTNKPRRVLGIKGEAFHCYSQPNMGTQLQRALAMVAMGHLDEGIQMMRAIVRANEDLETMDNLFRLLLRKNALPEAEELLGQIQVRYAEHADLDVLLAWLRLKQGRLNEAAQAASRAISARPSRSDIHLLDARIARASGDSRRMMESAHRAHLLSPGDRDAARFLSIALIRRFRVVEGLRVALRYAGFGYIRSGR